MKIDHYSSQFGKIKVPIYECEKTDCMFHHETKRTCALYFPHIEKEKCEQYTPITTRKTETKSKGN